MIIDIDLRIMRWKLIPENENKFSDIKLSILNILSFMFPNPFKCFEAWTIMLIDDFWRSTWDSLYWFISLIKVFIRSKIKGKRLILSSAYFNIYLLIPVLEIKLIMPRYQLCTEDYETSNVIYNLIWFFVNIPMKNWTIYRICILGKSYTLEHLQDIIINMNYLYYNQLMKVQPIIWIQSINDIR